MVKPPLKPGVKIAIQANPEPTEEDLQFWEQMGLRYAVLWTDQTKSGPEYYASRREIFAKHGIEVYGFGNADVYAFFGPTEAGMLRRAVGDLWPEAYRVYLEAYERDHGAYDQLFDGVVDLMTSLRSRGIRVGLVTGKGRDSAEISVRRTGLGPLLEAFETGSDDGLAKAHGITRVREAWGLASTEVAYVGDTPDDMKSCLEAGVTGLGAAWAKTASVVADPRWHCFGSVADLATWLDAHIDG